MTTVTAHACLDKIPLESDEGDVNRPPTTEGSQREAQESQKQVLQAEYPPTLRQVLISIGLLLGIFFW